MLRWAVSAFCAAVSLAIFSSPAHGTGLPAGPALFGTVALATNTTPYDARWTTVQVQALGSGQRLAAAARGLKGVERLRFVNEAVNETIRYRGDGASQGAGDHWATATQTFTRGAGDCEDYAIAKMQVLRAAGVEAHDLFLVIGYDRSAGAHAVLIARLGDQNWVLDNLQPQIRPAGDFDIFRPIITLSTSGRWLHGYRPGSVPPGPSSGASTITNGALAAVVATQNGRKSGR